MFIPQNRSVKCNHLPVFFEKMVFHFIPKIGEQSQTMAKPVHRCDTKSV